MSISKQTLYIVVGTILALMWVVSAHPFYPDSNAPSTRIDARDVPYTPPVDHSPSWQNMNDGYYEKQKDYRRSQDNRLQDRRWRELNEWQHDIYQNTERRIYD